MTTHKEADVNGCITMGGTANLFTLTEKSGMGAVSGAIDGAAYGEPTSGLKALANGDFEYTMMHYFLDKDGSSLHTHDRATLHPNPSGDGGSLEIEYTVVEGTGRLAGHVGTFRSRGWIKPTDAKGTTGKHSVGVVRFEGQICRS